jgi:hypothetical protein
LEEKDYSSIMSNILAQRKVAAKQTLNKEDDIRKRRRQLGRARSNNSTGDDPLSRGSSITAQTGTADIDRDVHSNSSGEKGAGLGKAAEYQPSQELGWDAPGAQEARERMIRAMGGTVEETGGVVQPIGVMKDAVRGDEGLGRAGRRKRTPGF